MNIIKFPYDYLLYISGTHLTEPHYVNCGEGVKSNSCNKCSGTGNPNLWCSGDCEWDSWFQSCEEKFDEFENLKNFDFENFD